MVQQLRLAPHDVQGEGKQIVIHDMRDLEAGQDALKLALCQVAWKIDRVLDLKRFNRLALRNHNDTSARCVGILY